MHRPNRLDTADIQEISKYMRGYATLLAAGKARDGRKRLQWKPYTNSFSVDCRKKDDTYSEADYPNFNEAIDAYNEL